MSFRSHDGLKNGFTIIEVLIVLAIAGLIMLIVFLAIPSLQRNNRNTSRRQDVSKIATLISEQVTNKRGQVPDSCDTTSTTCFLNDETLFIFKQPDYIIRYSRLTAANNYGAPDADHVVRIYNFMKCAENYDWEADSFSGSGSGQLAVSRGANYKSFVILYYLESSRGVTPQCFEF